MKTENKLLIFFGILTMLAVFGGLYIIDMKASELKPQENISNDTFHIRNQSNNKIEFYSLHSHVSDYTTVIINKSYIINMTDDNETLIITVNTSRK
jgi:hypothetical protein